MKNKMSNKKMLEKVTNYIMEMDFRDKWEEINWLLGQTYKDDFDKLSEDWNLNKEGEIC